MCFFLVIPYGGEKKHINKIPPKIPGQSRENFVYVFFSLCVFFAPYNLSVTFPDLFSRILLSFLPPLLATSLPPFSRHTFRPLLPLEKCSVL